MVPLVAFIRLGSTADQCKFGSICFRNPEVLSRSDEGGQLSNSQQRLYCCGRGACRDRMGFLCCLQVGGGNLFACVSLATIPTLGLSGIGDSRFRFSGFFGFRTGGLLICSMKPVVLPFCKSSIILATRCISTLI